MLHVKWSHTSGSPQKGELPFLRTWLSFPQCYGLDRLQILCSHFFKEGVLSQLHSPLLSWSSSCQYPGGNIHRPYLSISRFGWLSGHLPSVSLLMKSPSWLQSIQLYDSMGSLSGPIVSPVLEEYWAREMLILQSGCRAAETSRTSDCEIHVQFHLGNKHRGRMETERETLQFL